MRLRELRTTAGYWCQCSGADTQNIFSGMLFSFIKQMGILQAECLSYPQDGTSPDSNGRTGRAQWMSLCTFTLGHMPQRRRSNSESKLGIGSRFAKNIVHCSECEPTREAS